MEPRRYDALTAATQEEWFDADEDEWEQVIAAEELAMLAQNHIDVVTWLMLSLVGQLAAHI